MAIPLEGMKELELSMHDLAIALGFNSRWADEMTRITLEQQPRPLRRHVDGIDMLNSEGLRVVQ